MLGSNYEQQRQSGSRRRQKANCPEWQTPIVFFLRGQARDTLTRTTLSAELSGELSPRCLARPETLAPRLSKDVASMLMKLMLAAIPVLSDSSTTLPGPALGNGNYGQCAPSGTRCASLAWHGELDFQFVREYPVEGSGKYG